MTLGILWWSYATDRLSLRAVRVGLALQELRLRRAAYVWTERKRGRGPEFTPSYSLRELAALCGLPTKRVKAALAELRALGYLVEFSPERIVWAPSVDSLLLPPEALVEFRAWFGRLTKRKRVPIPRRILTLACESSSPALIATILGVCLRCSWKKPEGFSFTGRVSCTWMAARFSLSLRAIQSAKEHLVGLGWIQRSGDISRFGERLSINPKWYRIAATNEGEKLCAKRAGGEPSEEIDGTNPAGVTPPDGTNPAGVSLTRESLPPEEIKDQRESRGREHPEPGPGIFISHPGGENPEAPAGSELPPPWLSRIQPEDFRDVGRALELFRQAVKCGLIPDSEHARLLWMTAIEKARTVPAKNPAGLFLYLVKNRKWDYLSQGHEEAARERLNAFLFGERTPPSFPVPGLLVKEIPAEIPSRPRLSGDASTLQAIRNRGIRDLEAAYPSLRAAGWDRPRFVAARAELEKGRGSLAHAV